VDGREVCSLSSGESVIIKKSPFPIPCVVRGEGGGGWARDIKYALSLICATQADIQLATTIQYQFQKLGSSSTYNVIEYMQAVIVIMYRHLVLRRSASPPIFLRRPSHSLPSFPTPPSPSLWTYRYLSSISLP
jgi:hypothetical protein